MKTQQIVLAAATVMLLTTSPVWADHHKEVNHPIHQNKDEDAPKPHHSYAKAPEIDAASGASAIALLTGALLLASERSRSRRS
jgi:hypothetical protein